MRGFGGKVLQFCPHFSVDDNVLCSAWDGQQYRPTEFQKKEYCTANGYRTCPRFTAVARTPDVAVKIPMDDRR